MSARPSTKAQQHLGYDEIHAGDVLPATVLHVDPAGAKLRVGGRGGVVGKCRVEHMTEQAVAKPHTKLTKGQAVECLVIECEPARAKLLLSIKPSLVGSTLPRLLSYELAEVHPPPSHQPHCLNRHVTLSPSESQTTLPPRLS